MTSSGPSFDEFYRREWRPLTALGWTLTGSWSAAEELAQEALLDAYRRWEMVAGLDKPGAWARRAVVNRSASYHRGRGAESRALRQLATMVTSRSPAADEAGLDADDAAFWAAVRSLPARQAHCVALHYLEDRSVAEIAAILDCAAATVKVHLHRGRNALARRLGERPAEVIPLETLGGAVAGPIDEQEERS